MKRWWLVIALLLSLGVNVGVLAMITVHRLQPQQRFGPRPPTPQAGVDLLADRLGLDEPARSAFIDRQLEFFEQVQPLRQKLFALRHDLRDELTADQPDRQRVAELVDETAQTYGHVEEAVTLLVLDSRELLSPRQQRLYLHFVARLRDQELGTGGGPRGRHRGLRDRQGPAPPPP